MQLITQSLLASVFLIVAVVSSPQGTPPSGGSGGVQGECNAFCCERNFGTGGTMCKNNTGPADPNTGDRTYIYGGDCKTMPIGNNKNGTGKATPVCCANPWCRDQPGWREPILPN